MRITGDRVWGEPEDGAAARAVLRRAVELGANLIDTADAYGPEVSERLIAAALRPYPEGLVIATKGGFLHDGPGQWRPRGRPEHLAAACVASLRRLKLERIDLYQLHHVDPGVPIEDSVGALAELQQAGKVRHVGVCNVSSEELARARAVTDIVSVQNRYNLAEREYDDLVDECEREGIGFIPWFPLQAGDLAAAAGPLAGVGRRHGATPAQVALAWLLQRSPAMLPIPGTSAIGHLEENMAAAQLELSAADLAELANL